MSWKECTTPEGEVYYHNTATQELCWDPPEELMDKTKAGTKWVFIPDPDDAFIPVQVQGTSEDGKTITVIKDGQTVEVPAAETREISREGMLNRDVEDLVQLDCVNEGSIIHALRKRYLEDKIYTWVGDILVSINPFRLLPLYSPTIMTSYAEQGTTTMPPHTYHVAHEAFIGLITQEEGMGLNQSILISGESGAGKTEATKQCLSYLSETVGSTSGVEQKLMASNPILEAFGNAKTLRNNNSSRFGKFMEVHFSTLGQVTIEGCCIDNYLLEKSRVVAQAKDERSYHIFYMLCTGLPRDEVREDLMLEDASVDPFNFLNHSGCTRIDGVDDEQEFQNLQTAFVDLEIETEERRSLYNLVSAILHLGNITFEEAKGKDGVSVVAAVSPAAQEALESSATLLKVDMSRLGELLVTHESLIRGETVVSLHTTAQAEASQASLAKSLYSLMFDWIVQRLNVGMQTTEANPRFIGILDIFGFEIFQVNSFEQLCINFTNEKLQSHFNQNVFDYESKLYQDEGLDFTMPQWVDNQPVLDLIEGRPDGILVILDDQVNVPRATDTSFLDKCDKTHMAKIKLYADRKTKLHSEDLVFRITHYAGEVTYNANGFLEKNKDELWASLTDLMKSSEIPFVSNELFGDHDDPGQSPHGGGGSAIKGKGKRKTQAGQFKKQLSELMHKLEQTRPQYIRCVKANSMKVPRTFESPLCMQQLKYAGVLEAVSIRKRGLPFRHMHERFFKLHRCIAPHAVPGSIEQPDYKEACRMLLEAMQESMPAAHGCHFGKTRILYQSVTHRSLELALHFAHDKACFFLQCIGRGFIGRLHVWELRKAMKDVAEAQKVRSAADLAQAIDDIESLALKDYVDHKIIDDAKFALDVLTAETEAEKSWVAILAKGALEDDEEAGTGAEAFVAAKQAMLDLAQQTRFWRDRDPEAFKTPSVLQGLQGLGLASPIKTLLKVGAMKEMEVFDLGVSFMAQWAAEDAAQLGVDGACSFAEADAMRTALRLEKELRDIITALETSAATAERVDIDSAIGRATTFKTSHADAEDTLQATERFAQGLKNCEATLKALEEEEKLLREMIEGPCCDQMRLRGVPEAGEGEALDLTQYLVDITPDTTICTSQLDEVAAKAEKLGLRSGTGKRLLAAVQHLAILRRAYVAAVLAKPDEWKCPEWEAVTNASKVIEQAIEQASIGAMANASECPPLHKQASGMSKELGRDVTSIKTLEFCAVHDDLTRRGAVAQLMDDIDEATSLTDTAGLARALDKAKTLQAAIDAAADPTVKPAVDQARSLYDQFLALDGNIASALKTMDPVTLEAVTADIAAVKYGEAEASPVHAKVVDLQERTAKTLEAKRLLEEGSKTRDAALLTQAVGLANEAGYSDDGKSGEEPVKEARALAKKIQAVDEGLDNAMQTMGKDAERLLSVTLTRAAEIEYDSATSVGKDLCDKAKALLEQVVAVTKQCREAVAVVEVEEMQAAVQAVKNLRIDEIHDVGALQGLLSLPKMKLLQQQLRAAVKLNDENRKFRVGVELTKAYFDSLGTMADQLMDLSRFPYLRSPDDFALINYDLAKQKAKQLTKRKKEAEEKHLARIASKVGNTPRKSIMSKQHQAAAAEPDGLTLRESMLRWQKGPLHKTLSTRYLEPDTNSIDFMSAITNSFTLRNRAAAEQEPDAPLTVFEILTADRVWVLRASTFDEKCSWLHFLKAKSRSTVTVEGDMPEGGADAVEEFQLKSVMDKRGAFFQWKERFMVASGDEIVGYEASDIADRKGSMKIVDITTIRTFIGADVALGDHAKKTPAEEARRAKARHKKAMSVFKSIQCFMTDRQCVYPQQMAQEVCQAAIDEPLIADEVYCQLMKQLTQNPHVESLNRGWNLMDLCLSTFPPSESLSSYLEYFVHVHEEEDCLVKLSFIVEDGPQRKPPPVEQVEALCTPARRRLSLGTDVKSIQNAAIRRDKLLRKSFWGDRGHTIGEGSEQPETKEAEEKEPATAPSRRLSSVSRRQSSLAGPAVPGVPGVPLPPKPAGGAPLPPKPTGGVPLPPKPGVVPKPPPAPGAPKPTPVEAPAAPAETGAFKAPSTAPPPPPPPAP